jgi:glucoside 3-dehydrogenase (cytochrome c) hitch-hiker subunit
VKREDTDGLTRRAAIKIAAGAAFSLPALFTRSAAAVPFAAAPAAAPAPRFFTKDEYALLDEMTELIIPTDGHSPGARAARVAAYIDGRLAEAFLPVEADVQQRWRDGLRRVNALSQEMNGAAFLTASPEKRVAVLTRLAASEKEPKTDDEKFFRELKGATIHGYYTSEIGIHQEMEYKGNTLQQEYAGEEPT